LQKNKKINSPQKKSRFHFIDNAIFYLLRKLHRLGTKFPPYAVEKGGKAALFAVKNRGDKF